MASIFFVLDWASVTWPPGALSESYNIDATNPGNDVTISMTGSTGSFDSGSPGIGTGLGGTGRSSLQLSTGGLLQSEGIVVTINFNYTNGVYVQNLNILNDSDGWLPLRRHLWRRVICAAR
jgi:hypothetical protein